MAGTGKILTLVDLPDGELDETGRGLASYCSRLAAVLDSAWGVVTLVAPAEGPLAGLAAHGVPEITCVADGEKLLDMPAVLGKILAGLAAGEAAGMVVLPHNDLGSTLAPVMAAALDAALLTEVTGARREGPGLRLSRSALGARMAETMLWDARRPLVLTVGLRSLSQVLLPSVRPGNPVVATWRPAELPSGPAAIVTGRIPPDPQTVDLSEAEVIFSAGKGCAPTTFEQLKELCRLLNVSFGVTRPVYDLGWTGFERMVGQTGRSVAPRLYVALGISGSPHHVGGIKDSRRIVAINSDPKAPIFPNADEGFMADLADVLPRLLQRARAARGGAA